MNDTTVTTALETDLTRLHASYVAAVNNAVAADDYALVDELAAAYDRDAIDLMRATVHAA
jgi:hypothetical protein